MDEDIVKFLRNTMGGWSPSILSLLLTLSVAIPLYNLILKLVEIGGWFKEGGLFKFFATPSFLRLVVFHAIPFSVYVAVRASSLNTVDYFRTFIFFHFALVCLVIVVAYGPRAWWAAMQPWPLERESDFLAMAIWDGWFIWLVWTMVVNIGARPWPVHGLLDDVNTLMTTYGSFVGIAFIELSYRFYSGRPFQESLAMSLLLWVLAAVFSATFVVIAGPVVR